MDSLSEAQQQQIGQFQQQVQQHIEQFQKQIHEHTQQALQQQQQHQETRQQDASETTDHSQSQVSQQLDQENQQQQSKPESNPVHPLGEEPSKNAESSGTKEGQTEVQQQPNADSGLAGDQSNVGIPGLNPAAAAAVAALAQLTQFAGTMSAAERAILELGLQQLSAAGGYGQIMAPGFGQGPMPFQDHRSSYRGGGRRGRGRGRGRGPGRGGGPRHYPPSTSSTQEPSAAADVASSEPTEENREPSSDKHQNSEAPAEAPHQTLPPANVGPTRIGWCEVCKVQCTSLEILEQQHKNGKRHKKNLLKLGDSKPEDTEDKVTDDQRVGMKRNMTGGGRGGKRAKTIGGPDHQPKVVIPLICDLCNVKCDTQEVFDRHLAGKKHIAKVKRYEGHQAMYGPMGLQALYPPNPITQTLYNPLTQTQQGSYGPPGVYVDPQAYYAATGSGYQQNPDPNAIPNLGAQN